MDASWLAQLLECGLLAGSFIPPENVKALRDVVRYRKKLVEQRSSEIQRLGGVLQDAGIKLDSVASAIDTVSGLDMIRALIDGERRGAVLADLARGRMRAKIADLSLALDGRFDAHHALMCTLHLEHIASLNEMIARLDAQVEKMMAPFARQRDLLVTIPGIGPRVASVIISEIGAEVAGYFTTDAHLASWAGLCPGNYESAGKRKHGRPRKGSRHLKPALVEAAWAAVQSDGRLKARYHRLVLRFRRLPEQDRQEEGHRRGRPHPDPDHLARAHRRRPLHRPRRRLLHPPHRPPARNQAPDRPAPGPWPQSHYRPGSRVSKPEPASAGAPPGAAAHQLGPSLVLVSRHRRSVRRRRRARLPGRPATSHAVARTLSAAAALNGAALLLLVTGPCLPPYGLLQSRLLQQGPVSSTGRDRGRGAAWQTERERSAPAVRRGAQDARSCPFGNRRGRWPFGL